MPWEEFIFILFLRMVAFLGYVGAAPILMHGRWMTPIPHKHPFTVVLGRPIKVPHLKDPSPEVVQEYLTKFTEEMRGLFERNKGTCGCGSQTLRVL